MADMNMGTWLALNAGIEGLKAYAAGRSNRKTREEELALAREKMAADENQSQRNVALEESSLDPFRQQLGQAKTIAKLDAMERGTFAPMSFSFDTPYAANIPTRTGGFNYTKGPDVTSSAAALKRNVMGGNVAPTMTNPSNYGKTAALDLVRMAADGVDPATVSASAPMARSGATGAPATDYLSGVTRRGGGTGGILSGAAKGAGAGATAASIAGPFTAFGGGVIGGLTGAITGAFNKKAKTAPMDVDVQTATTVLTNAIRTELGRAPNPGEIEQMLAGQGLKPGDRWVGEQGLQSLIASIQQQATTSLQPSYIGRG